MIWREMLDWVLAVLAGVLLLLGVFWASYALNERACEARWSRSGVAWQFGFWEGCLVEVRPGVWVPDDRVREMDLSPQGR